MPKKLNISSNERVDLEDFNRASAEYTQESDNFERQKLFQARRSLVASGFRIEISDQTTSPGQFTIYNGLSLDRSGNILNNEQQVSDARTMTLSGGGSSFYIEIEFVEGESDVDARAFWDPTFSGNTPPGKEFSLNVATRVTPNWQVVSPVAATGFDVDITDINSVKIPIAVLTTNGANEIVGFTVQNASTVLEEDVLSAVTEIRVLDSTLFPTTGDATLDFGGANPETVSIIGNDLVNGIITFGGPTSFAHNAGAILRETVVPASFVPESKLAAPSADEDRRRRLFAGDEARGGALAQDSQDVAARSDLAIKSLKDHVDFLAGQIREMKFGTSRVGETTTSDPSFTTAERHYDYAGSIAGVRSWNYTIGDTVSSLGDFNAASDDFGTQLQAAHDALDATDGGSILIKEGDYVWDATVTVTKPVSIVFAEGVTFVAGTYASAPVSIAAGVKVELIGMPAVPATELPFPVTAQNFAFIELIVVDSTLQVDFTAATSVNNSSFDFRGCTFPAESSAGAFKTNNGTAEFFAKMSFKDCLFQHNDTTDLTTEAIVDIQLSNAIFEDCVFDLAAGTGTANQLLIVNDVDDTTGPNIFSRCKFIESTTGEALGPIRILPDSFDFVVFNECHFELTWAATTASAIERSFIYTDAALRFNNCTFANFDVPDSADTSIDTYGACIRTPLDDGWIFISDSSFTSGDFNSFNAAHVGKASSWLQVNGSSFSSFYKSLYVDTADPLEVKNCRFNGFASDLALTEVIGVEFTTGLAEVSRQAIISDNKFSWISGIVSAAFTYTAIKAHDSDIDNAITQIQNNEITMVPNTGQTVGINLSEIGKINGKGRAIVTGNTIYQPPGAYAGSTSSYWGIKSDASASLFFPPFSWTISNNNISIAANTLSGSGTCYGIQIIGPTTYERFNNSSGYLIGGNNITAWGTDTGGARGIEFEGVGASLSNNNITVQGGDSVSNTACLKVDGHWITINGNMCYIEDTGTCVDVEIPAITNFSDDTHGGHISIINNTIDSKLTVGGCISLFSNADQIAGININNNNISADHAATNDDDFISVLLNGLGHAASISNNTISEQTRPDTGNSRDAIFFINTDVWKGCTINGNSIGSRNYLTGAVRSSSSAAISVAGTDLLTSLSVCGNVISGWVDVGGANRRSIDINDVDGVTCTGNACQYSGAGGEPVIRIDSCNNVVVVGNEADDYNIQTSTSSDVVGNNTMNNGTFT
jgi:hypothetical protein